MLWLWLSLISFSLLLGHVVVVVRELDLRPSRVLSESETCRGVKYKSGNLGVSRRETYE